ncbi:MAG: HAMP domain-containing histidine kinase [Clostridia bacterium]|nr:HAMP domain-containing histidine kinase [Clostridia bacterium]
MKAFNKIFIISLVIVIAIFVVANLVLFVGGEDDEGRPYLVEISRISQEIEAGTFDKNNLEEYDYVTKVVKMGDTYFNQITKEEEVIDEEKFYNAKSDYVVREINGELYRFDYGIEPINAKTKDIVTLNVTFAVVVCSVIFGLLYVRHKILKPFERLKEVPYELSRGNLATPIKETKSKFFGRFIWGVDMLRENMEQQKERELKLQKDRKTLLLALSHDVKTPLSAIKLYSQALSTGLYDDKEKQIEVAKSINEKADEIENYVSQIITASREDFLTFEVQNGEFYLGELVEKIKSYYSEKLALIKTEFVIDDYVNAIVNGDLNRAVEVVENVIENAIKYGDGKSISLHFSSEEGCALLTVRNSGCTLPDTDLPHVFESFWRGTNSDNEKGSGLGLYICRQLMRKMNGEIFAEIDGTDMCVTIVFQKA